MSSNFSNVFPSQNIPEKKCFVAPARGEAAIVLENSDIKDFSILNALISLDEDTLLCVPESHCAIGVPRHKVVSICIVFDYINIRVCGKLYQRLTFGQVY
jgi:hypothetical protein